MLSYMLIGMIGGLALGTTLYYAKEAALWFLDRRAARREARRFRAVQDARIRHQAKLRHPSSRRYREEPK